MDAGECSPTHWASSDDRGRMFVQAQRPGVRRHDCGHPQPRQRPGGQCHPHQAARRSFRHVSGKEDAIKITPPIMLTLEYGVEFIDDDELRSRSRRSPSGYALRCKRTRPQEGRARGAVKKPTASFPAWLNQPDRAWPHCGGAASSRTGDMITAKMSGRKAAAAGDEVGESCSRSPDRHAAAAGWSDPARPGTAPPTTSSNEVAKANKAPDSTPGQTMGSITRRNASTGRGAQPTVQRAAGPCRSRPGWH